MSVSVFRWIIHTTPIMLKILITNLLILFLIQNVIRCSLSRLENLEMIWMEDEGGFLKYYLVLSYVTFL